jgi:hypothetical protein
MAASQVTWRGVFQLVAVIGAIMLVRAWLAHSAESDAREALLSSFPGFSCDQLSFDTEKWQMGTSWSGKATSTYSMLDMPRTCRSQLQRLVRRNGWIPEREFQSRGNSWYMVRQGTELRLRFEKEEIWYSYRKSPPRKCLAKACQPQEKTPGPS